MESWKESITERLQGSYTYIVIGLLVLMVIVYIYLRAAGKKKKTTDKSSTTSNEETTEKDEIDELIESINEKQSSDKSE